METVRLLEVPGKRSLLQFLPPLIPDMIPFLLKRSLILLRKCKIG